VESAAQMYEACVSIFPTCNAGILCAAVADFTPEHTAENKIKREGDQLVIRLNPTQDIAQAMGISTVSVSKALTDVGELSISLSNNNAEIETYYIEDGVLKICVIAKADGNVDLTVSAEAKSKYNNTKVQTFSSTASISVDYTKNEVDIFMVIVWITFGVFCLSIIIYLSISVVKARKNDVK
jgi:hypothetical protein